MKTDERNKFAIKSFLGEYLDLRKDKDNELATVDSIRKGVEFKGANLWILIFAIFMASLGLNVNSTAVIIGAMLISPLMGPIMGVGLSVGLNDFELMKRSLKSFLITTAFSVTTATIFFLLAPIAGSQSELLARTSPTIYDVFIALFGGLAGVVALSTKEKGNVIPGVAIATALMPPLCTAGYGLASGNLIYFLGAFYLYFINSVFISLATFLGMRIDIRTKRPILHNNVGGLSGPAIFPVAVRMVWQCYNAVKIPIIGMGGISTWEDAVEMMMAGASAIQMGTAIFTDPWSPIKVIEGLNDYMDKNGIKDLSEIVGQVKPWD